MKRRSFLKRTVGGVGIASLLPMALEAAAPTNAQGERLADRWQQLGTGTTGLPAEVQLEWERPVASGAQVRH